MKKRVWCSQINNTFGRSCFLPYSVGSLVAKSKSISAVNDAYDFCGFIYLREDPDTVVERMGSVDVLGLSCYTWNWQISNALAKRTKEVNPNCLIVMGGPHVPTRDERFFEKHPYVDVVIHAEGELAFAEVLLKHENGQTLRGFLHGERVANLDSLPSPYLDGTFDELLEDRRWEWQVTQEFNRGCPFSCT